MPDGFTSVTAGGRIKVTLNKDGTITINDGNGSDAVEIQTKEGVSNLKVVNQADTVGGLEVHKDWPACGWRNKGKPFWRGFYLDK